VKDRGKPVNIELLTYQQRKQILKGYAERLFTDDGIPELVDLLSERFLELCITETWGIRGGINNLVSTSQFLVELMVDGLAGELRDLADFTNLEETEESDYIKREEGVIKLTYQTSQGSKELVLTKRIGIEPRVIKEDEREITVKEIITGKDIETSKPFVED